jgi:alpha-beta hydrolase superfamily lysophospholipase
MNISLTQAHLKTGYLRSKDQTQLFFRHYELPEKKATIFLVHGFGEHSGRYSHLIEQLNAHNYEVFCIDLRGHGYSHGKRGHIYAFCRYEEDIFFSLKFLQETSSNKRRIFLLAHSMGALVSLRLMDNFKPPIQGMILSSPLFALKISLPRWKKWGAKAIANLLPQLKIKTGIKGSHLSSDQKIAINYDSDRLVLKHLSLRAFSEIITSYKNINFLAKKMTFSFFIQAAEKDPIVDNNAIKEWFSLVDQTKVDATIKIYPDLLHEIYNETCRTLVIEDMLSWLAKRV